MPQDERNIIRSKLAPTIGLDDVVMEDLFTGTSDKLGPIQKGTKTGRQIHLDIGTNYPHATINSYTFTVQEILKFEIDASKFLPRIYLKVVLTGSAAFKSHGVPKDGDILSIFLRAKDDAFKPIRNDYLLTSVNIGPGGSEGRGSTMEFFGNLFIPHFEDEIIKGYKGTTLDVLQKICKEIGLGFATNETETNDDQNWLCAGDTYNNFIPHIVKHAWKNDKSFYNCFIDVYYHLNFINVNSQVDGDGKLDAAILDSTMMKDYLSDSVAEEVSKVKTAKLLSDMDNLSGTNMFIRTYEVENNASRVSKDWGYKSYVQFFDQKSGKTWEIFVDPIVSDGAADKKIILKGRPVPKAADGTAAEKYWETQNKYFWRGIQYKDVHDKYLFAELWNERNLVELTKMGLLVHVERWNPNIYRGERMPLLFYTMTDTPKRVMDSAVGDEPVPAGQTPAVMDQFYSGYYMVDGIKFTYAMVGGSTDYENPPKGPTPSGIVQIFTMKRREWPIPGGPPSDNSPPVTSTPGQV